MGREDVIRTSLMKMVSYLEYVKGGGFEYIGMEKGSA
jgi:hypothetical protein